MPVREAPDRRGRDVRGSSGLLERDSALRAIQRTLDGAQEGAGQALLIEGHAGMGKTRLHEAALDGARERGMRVLRAAGAELERSIAFGVAARLLSAQLGDLPAARRDALLTGAPEAVRALSGRGEAPQPPDAGSDLALAHGIFTLLATADETRPALIAIDDLHWCDVPSLEFVLYVLHRLEELPIAMLLARRVGLGEQASETLDVIAAHPRVGLEKLSPLGAEAVGDLVRQALGSRASVGLVKACQEATAGNPFYLHELLLALREEHDLSSDELAQHARALAPDAVTRIVRVRVGRLGTAAAALARAVAILGDDVPLRHAAHLAGLPVQAASVAAEALAAVEVLLAREPLRFVHPLVRHAVANDIPAFEQAGRHLDAARLLYAEGAHPEQVAAHLLLGRGQADDWVVEQLRAAAREARARAAPQSAVSYLRRALEEPPPEELRAEVIAELGVAEAAIGLPTAAERLAQAAAFSRSPRRRAELALERGRALDATGLHGQAARAYEEGLRELPPRVSKDGLELHDQLQTGFLATAMMVPSLQGRALARSEQLLTRIPEAPRSQGQRLLLAQAALRATFAGEPAPAVVELAERAWDAGGLLEQAAPQWLGWRLVSAALCLAGELERAVEVAGAAIEDARRRGWPLGFATASFMRALPRLWQGQVDAALADLESARDARRYGWQQFERTAAAHYALCLIEKGELEPAEQMLAEEARPQSPLDLEDALRMYSLGELRLAQGRPEEALEIALSAGEVAERTVGFFGYYPWRTSAAQAALALGDRDRALALVREAAARADRTQVLHLRIGALRVMGLCQTGEAGIETLQAAVRLGHSGPPRLETIRALVDLGAALRRANQRVACRQPLQLAVDTAQRSGASAIQARARTELAATGARPRRDGLLSGPASLTPSERRIAERAATGESNRDIARALFVTPKTVEYHLRNVYRKLGIEKRRELSQALNPS
jgi:DNA-binding CsgD family transcriptional regulator